MATMAAPPTAQMYCACKEEHRRQLNAENVQGCVRILVVVSSRIKSQIGLRYMYSNNCYNSWKSRAMVINRLVKTAKVWFFEFGNVFTKQ